MSTLKVNNITDLGDDAIVTDGVVPAYPGQILQVVSTTKTDTFSTTSTTFTDVTGLSISITPASTSSKILVSFDGMIGSSGGGPITGLRLLRDSTSIGNGDIAGTRESGFDGFRADTTYSSLSTSYNYLDSPATTSLVTYKIQMTTSAGTSFLNRTNYDADDGNMVRGASTLTLMEVAG